MTRMKTLTKLLCAVLVLCGLLCCAGAEECGHTFTDGACTTCGMTGGYCGAEGGEQSVIWTLKDNHLVISGTGAMADSFYEDLPWRDAYQTITDVTIGEGVTRIGKHAFFDFQSVTEITIPASVESIGYQAFKNSTVSSVTFAPNSRLTTIDDNAFSYLVSLKQITLPASVESIGDGAFEYCFALETVTFEEGSRLSSLGHMPFSGCDSLTAISIPESVTAYKTIDGVLYSGDGTTLLCYPEGKTDEAFTTPAGVTTIAESALFYAQFRTVILSEGVTTIGNSAFFGCSSMQSVSLPSTLTSIGNLAFTNCDGLTTITIPANVTSIGDSAFDSCYSLTEVTIPASVSSIGDFAFNFCGALTTVNAPCSWDGSLYTFADTVTVVVADHAFADGKCTACGVTGGYCGASTNAGGVQSVVWTYRDGTLTITGEGAMADYEGGNAPPWLTWQTSLTSVYIGEGVKSVSVYAFMGFTKLSSLHLAEGLKVIGPNAFAGCNMLETVVLPSSLTSIGGGAFFDCHALTGIVIPEGVKTIGVNAFLRCTAMTTVTIPVSVTSMGEGAFEGCTALTTVNVPCTWMETPLYTFGEGVTLDYVPHDYDEGGVCTLCSYAAKASIERAADVLYFDTLPDALAAAEPDDKFYVLADCDEDITIPSHCEWYGSDFTCSGTVVNNGIIYEGVFTGHVTNNDSIVGGTFSGEVINQFIICGGTFNNAVTNDDHLSSGAFNGTLTNNATIDNVAGVSWFTLGADFVIVNNGTITCEAHIDLTAANCQHGETCRLCGEFGEKDPANHSYQSNICCGVCGAEGDGANVKWTLVDGVLSITGTGDMADYVDYTARPWYDARTTITSLTISEGVTSIGNRAFDQFVIESITIPASVKTLDSCAFQSCEKLTTVTFAKDSQLTTIASSAFANCYALEQITLPAGVERIGSSVFINCFALTHVFVEDGNDTYKDIDGVLYTADGKNLLFYPAGKTEEAFLIPAGVETIGMMAFMSCNNLTTITIPASVTSIHAYAFMYCDALTTVSAPCNWDGSLFTFADTVTVNVAEHTGGKANCQSAAICGNCGEAYGEPDYDIHPNTEVVWEWNPDGEYVYAYATLTCSDCGDELEVTSGEGEFLGSVEPVDCQNPGSASYSAALTFEDGTVVNGTHTVIIPSENHVGPMNSGFCTACGDAEMPTVDPGEYEDETWDDVYLIANAGQLYWFANKVNGGSNGIGGRLTANITVPASVSTGGSIPDWEPIGQGWTPYCGAFNGGGHTISGLYCEASRAGLFGYTDYNYTIRNVGVVNGTFIGSDYAGALAGYASSEISGCWASGNTVEGNYAGGLVGYNYGNITGSRGTNNTVKGSLAGGLVGYNNYGTIDRSYGTGNTVTGDSAGGLSGENYGTVKNSYATGNSTGYLVGYNGDPITNCFTDGSALFRDSYGDVTNSYYVAAAATDDGGRTAAQFASGEIAYLLQSGIEPEEVYDEETGEWVMADAPLVWGQSVGSASYPTLGGKRVYQVLSCDGESKAYSNTDAPQMHSFTDSVCANCGFTGGFCGAEGDGTNIAWTLEDGTLAITGTGAMADYEYAKAPWFSSRYSITSLTITEGVTNIGGLAFTACSITEVIIPASADSVGDSAFMNCHHLERVSFAEGSRLTTIVDGAFQNCFNLMQITLPAGVTAIGDLAFSNCNSLTDIFVAEGNETYKDIDGVLYSADGTTLLIYPEGKTADTFITPEGVKIIADSACEGASFQKVILSDGVTSIGYLAFSSNPNLLEVTIPSSVTSIHSSFLACDALTTVNVPCNWDGSLYTFKDTVTVNVPDHDFSSGACTDCGFCPHDTGNGNTCGICGATVNRKLVILPASLTAIEDSAFTGTAAEAIVIPAGCTSIGAGAFTGCPNLQVIVFDGANATIGSGAIPEGVIIIAPAGGTVEAWAEANGLTFMAR